MNSLYSSNTLALLLVNIPSAMRDVQDDDIAFMHCV